MTIEQVAALAMALPETAEVEKYGRRSWAVRSKAFVWERPFSKADLKRFGTVTPPSGAIVAIAVADLNEKESVLAEQPDSFFTIPHFDGYAAVLVQLDAATKEVLSEALIDGWLACAPPALSQVYLDSTSG